MSKKVTLKREEMPEKLHMPKDEKCENGHTLVRDGKPTRIVVWDQEGNPECLNCALNHIGHAQMAKGKCKNGHDVKPGDVSFVWNNGKAEPTCPQCKS